MGFNINNKHAFLIMVHNEFKILTALVGLLDHERNDIYIHFDKKVEHLPAIECKHSSLFILKERIDNRWGTETQIQVEFLIFAEAAKHGPYEYYHLLSGVDLPIKPMWFIHEFFENAGGGEFVELTTDSEKYAFRIRQYHFGVDKIRSKNIFIFLFAKVFGKISPAIQRFCGIKRNTDIQIAYGSNWVSITDDFVHYLLEHKEDTLHRYKHSKCADELFLQTILYNSPFRDRLYLTADGKTCNMRVIEWNKSGRMRGMPRIYKESDFRKLINSPMLFARKFSSHDMTIVNKLISHIKSQS